ncbi:tetratricopeptide repeat protein [Sphingomonas sp. GCM10030256]|uniref:tetratricopeptide repeat protein n=1 Tax=Sphingomonas sp. GCM10030256 TaxID=3273427 RepID=UPI00361C5A56
MIAAIALAAALAGAPLDEAAHALAAGRTEQARTMIARAVAAGQSGPEVDRLLADLAFTSGDWAVAAGAYRVLLTRAPNDCGLAERGGIAAFRAGDAEQAMALLDRPACAATVGWHGWNARAVAADRQSDWATADRAYARALELAPSEARLLNNLGWSRLLRGDWNGAVEPLERAASLDPGNLRIAANLDLARSAVADSLPARRAGESSTAWAARLNDAGVAAARQGDRARAVAAFAQAVEASDRWFARAANNLAAVEKQP